LYPPHEPENQPTGHRSEEEAHAHQPSAALRTGLCGQIAGREVSTMSYSRTARLRVAAFGHRRTWPQKDQSVEAPCSSPIIRPGRRPVRDRAGRIHRRHPASPDTSMAPHDQPRRARRHGARAGAEHALGRSLPRLHVGRRACWTGVVRAPGGSCRPTHGDQAPLGLDSLWVGAVRRCRRVV
jgi:hypothetical protein